MLEERVEELFIEMEQLIVEAKDAREAGDCHAARLIGVQHELQSAQDELQHVKEENEVLNTGMCSVSGELEALRQLKVDTEAQTLKLREEMAAAQAKVSAQRIVVPL